MEYPAYLINLNERTDRLRSATAVAQRHLIDFERVEAVNLRDLSQKTCEFAPAGVVATFASHKKAFDFLLSSDAEYALILEDDFIPISSFSLPKLATLKELDFDILQLGYLHSTKIETLNILLMNTRSVILRIAVHALGFLRIRKVPLLQKRIVRELSSSPYYLVPSDIRPGGHAYIVSRHAAKVIIELNNPTFLSIDQLLISLSVMRTLKSARFFSSKVGQSDSPTSIVNRTL